MARWQGRCGTATTMMTAQAAREAAGHLPAHRQASTMPLVRQNRIYDFHLIFISFMLTLTSLAVR